jgi:unsaturated rhamnogalacturonyl hydrolase
MSQYRVATTPGPVAAPPQGKRFPFGWPAFAVTPNVEPPVLRWEGTDALPPGDARLRFTTALDDLEEKSVQATLAGSGETLGTFDLRYADALQTWEIPIPASVLPLVRAEGVALRLARGSKPLYVLCGAFGGDEEGGASDGLRPHLMFPSVGVDRWSEFQDRLCSLDSLETFGWHEGCVLDGILDLRDAGANPQADVAAKRHLDHYLAKDGGLIYEGPRGEPCDGRVYSIEGTLPFAALARVYPDHPLLSLASAFWKERIAANGAALDGKIATAEGCYTVAYPMAWLAKVRKQEVMAQMALRELRLRQDQLLAGGDLYLRHNAGTGERTYKNWARGVAWYLLGLTRTLIVLGDRPDVEDLREECRRAAQWAQIRQRNGLWNNYLDDPQARPDTAGSAGIAGALALAAKHGLLGSEAQTVAARTLAARTLAALTPHLTPDGLLTGVAPSNKGGEPLQRAPYRVIKKTGMGLVGVLLAALKS